jgi:predicted nucleotidyltransferase
METTVEIVKGAPILSLDELRSRICQYLAGTGVLRAVVFGSYARGDADEASDLDLLLVERTTLPFVERGRRHLPLFRLGLGVDLLIYTPDEYEELKREGHALIERVEREGVTILCTTGRPRVGGGSTRLKTTWRSRATPTEESSSTRSVSSPTSAPRRR